MADLDISSTPYLDEVIAADPDHGFRLSETSADNAYYGQVSLADARGILQGANPTYFTDARLRTMTKNDLLYAVRQVADSKPI